MSAGMIIRHLIKYCGEQRLAANIKMISESIRPTTNAKSTMGLTTAERNRRKRERKKKEREDQRKREAAKKESAAAEVVTNDDDVQIEYVAEPIADDEFAELRLFQERSLPALLGTTEAKDDDDDPASQRVIDDDDDDDSSQALSRRQLRDKNRPSVAQLKQRVRRPDLVEAHDVTAMEPEFLIQLKAVPGTVPVPRHWGRKRKYLQGKVRVDFVS